MYHPVIGMEQKLRETKRENSYIQWVRGDLSERITLKLRSEGNEGVSWLHMWDYHFLRKVGSKWLWPGRGHALPIWLE